MSARSVRPVLVDGSMSSYSPSALVSLSGTKGSILSSGLRLSGGREEVGVVRIIFYVDASGRRMRWSVDPALDFALRLVACLLWRTGNWG